ncbi:MAG TPA: class I SAM-dependent methyltransferase [Phycisphaerae bacterium]|nr:class I SAM-dependent methyltransferase [Phycisphaerae bacterium]
MNKRIPDPDARIAYFDAQADTWDHDGPSAAQALCRLEGLGGHLKLSPGLRLLEVGCGTGGLTGWLADQVRPGRVTAIDFAPRMIERAREKGIDADFAVLDACSDDLGEGLYDVIFCFHCFPHFRDQAAALRGFARALRPAGRLIVMHLRGSEQINAFHAGLAGAVGGDRLPQGAEWDPLLAQARLRAATMIDREDLFFLEASPAGTN